MILHLTSRQLKQISAHAERTYPEECCGLLIGRMTGQRIGQVDRTLPTKTLLEVWEVPNTWSLEIAKELSAAIPAPEDARLDFAKTDRYWIDPREMLRAQRYARDHQLDILGVYHSHPDHAAVPSECDRSLAWPQYSYLIVSVHRGKAQATHCWSLDANHQFQAEAIVIR